MASLTLYPAHLKGVCTPPPSKSIAHRALILSALSGGTTSFIPESADIAATKSCMKALLSGEKQFDCNESGSTLRFMIPLAMALRGGGTFIRKGKLVDRPLSLYQELFTQARFSAKEPLQVQGRLQSGNYVLRGDVSSQFITGLLLALPLVKGDSTLHVTEPFESSAYVDLTVDVMQAFGVDVKRFKANDFAVQGGQSYAPCHFEVEADYSQAAVFLTANALGHQVQVKGLNPASSQGDKVIEALLQSKSSEMDAAQCPDIIPLVALKMCLTEGRHRIKNAGRLRLKECDRLSETVNALGRMGAHIQQNGDAIDMEGVKCLQGGVTLDSCNDHRMAMMISIAALNAKEAVTLTGTQCVQKSWPDYFEVYRSLGGVTQ